jgi:hypothetical protein
MQHSMAFETGDVGMLTELRSNMQAGISSLINDMILSIAHRGVEIVAPQWKVNPTTGGVVIAKYTNDSTGEMESIEEIRANPLLKILMEFISKNNLSLEDMNMTPKVQSDNDVMSGFLDDESENRESTHEFRSRMIEQQDTLLELINASYKGKGKVIDGEVIEHG